MKNYKIVGSILLLFISGIIVLLISKTKIRIQQQKSYEHNIQNLPSFKFTMLNGTIFTSKNLIPNKPVIVVWFNPACEHCKYELEDIVKNINSFKDITLLFVSEEGLRLLNEFSCGHSLDTILHIKVLHSGYGYFISKFNKPAVPTTYIYSQSHQLIRVFKGETSAEAIIRVIYKNKTFKSETRKNKKNTYKSERPIRLWGSMSTKHNQIL